MLTILSITDSDKHFSTAIDEYSKRLWKNVTIRNIKPTKHGTQKQIIEKDTFQVISILEKKFSQHNKILLSKDGKTIDTQQFQKTIELWWKIVFLIGGPYGFNEKVLEKHIDKVISFGAMTVPHGLAKLLLLEQIYRAETIRIWKKYHY